MAYSMKANPALAVSPCSYPVKMVQATHLIAKPRAKKTVASVLTHCQPATRMVIHWKKFNLPGGSGWKAVLRWATLEVMRPIIAYSTLCSLQLPMPTVIYLVNDKEMKTHPPRHGSLAMSGWMKTMTASLTSPTQGKKIGSSSYTNEPGPSITAKLTWSLKHGQTKTATMFLKTLSLAQGMKSASYTPMAMFTAIRFLRYQKPRLHKARSATSP